MVIADDHPIVLAGLSGLLGADGGFSVLAAATDGRLALEAIVSLDPDIALLDLRMPLLAGAQVLGEMKRQGSRARGVILAGAASDSEIYDAIAAGAAGIIMKSAPTAKLLECLHAVANGAHWLQPGLTEPAVERETERRARWNALSASLTAREAEIVRMIIAGVSNKDIAFRLGVSDGTTKVHIGNVFRKLQVASRLELYLLVRGEGTTLGSLPAPHSSV
jgi:DNA-binding NarL/FixJ family response regulator